MEPGWETSIRRALPPIPPSVAQSRRLVREALLEAGRADLLDDAELLVSEVVTNALVHAGTTFEISASAGVRGLRVEVSDGSPHLPVMRNYSSLAGTGRGLRLLGLLSESWGVQETTDDPAATGKTVWFELCERDGRDPLDKGMLGAEALGTARALRSPGGAGPDSREIELLNVPLLLHAAWQMHAESMLREYLLSRLDEDSGDEIERHAAASDAIAILDAHIPAPDLGDDPEAVMAGATEPLVSAERLVVAVPEASVPHFRVLDEALDDALRMADSGAFLTPPIQPELRVLRRWLCNQVVGQSADASAQPWSSATDVLPAPGPQASWDSAWVQDSDLALIAADDTNRIIAASRSTARILGYAAPGQLVGLRLVSIIPERYHQAHLAGFTLHLASGRDPLLGVPVTVPARRRDGTETTVLLTVEAQQTSDGRSVFVGELVEQV